MYIFVYAEAFHVKQLILFLEIGIKLVSVFPPTSFSQTPRGELPSQSPVVAMFYMSCPLPVSSHPSPTGQGVAQSSHSAFSVRLWWACLKMWVDLGSMDREVAETEMKSSRNIWGQRDDSGPSLCTPRQTETKSAIFSSWFVSFGFFANQSFPRS